MNGMVLIEGEFANKIQSEVKELSEGIYKAPNLGKIPRNTRIYQNFTTPANQTTKLNSQAWGIRRIK